MSDHRPRIAQHLHALVGERHPSRSPKALARAARYLAAEFETSGWSVTRQPFQALGKTYRNILAVKQPPGRKSPRSTAPLLIGAHYDTVARSPGADDNASALVVLLEVARRLDGGRLTRPVWLVAFSLEEAGCLGSAAFAERVMQRKQPLTGALILECVGYARSEEATQQSPPGVPISVPTRGDFLAIVGNEASRLLVEAVSQAAARAAPALPTVPLAVPGDGTVLPDVRRSDHAPFWDRGYPAVMLTDTANFRNPHYHRPTDTIDTLNLDFLEAVIETVIASVEDLAGGARA